MLYLEDYLELIEHLPQELRDRFTDIREGDLQVHNSVEQLKEKVRHFFASAKKLDTQQRQCDYETLLQGFSKIEKYAVDKVHIADQMFDIMVKLAHRLDNELEKFKLELEADHTGITEQLERRSLELDSSVANFDDLISIQLNGGDFLSAPYGATSFSNTPASSASMQQQHHQQQQQQPVGIKDRRRSEHRHRHHPYSNNNNNQSNGYQGRGKLSSQERELSKSSVHHYNNSHDRQSVKLATNGACRQQSTATFSSYPAQKDGYGYSPSLSAPASVAGDTNGIDQFNHFGVANELNDAKRKNHNNSASNRQHSALGAALTSNDLYPSSNGSFGAPSSNNTKISGKDMKNVGRLCVNSPLSDNPIVAAASQAIAETQQLQIGRRTPSLKASYAAMNTGGLSSLDFVSGNKQDGLLGSNRNALSPMVPDQAFRNGQFGKLNGRSNGGSSPLFIQSVTKSGRNTKRPKIHHGSRLYLDESPASISSDNSVFENSESLSSADFMDTTTTFGSSSPSSLDFTNSNGQGNTTFYQRDETKYCTCRQISYGEMVACDNVRCEIEWFHYECVGISQPPKGKWFCPDCSRKMTGTNASNGTQSQSIKKRGRKEKSLFNIVSNSTESIKPNGRSKD